MIHVFSPPAHLEDFTVSFVRIGPLFGEHIIGLSLPNGTSLVRVYSHNGRTIAEAPIPGQILSVVFSICGRYVMIADSVSGVAISIIHSMQTEFQLKVPCMDTQVMRRRRTRPLRQRATRKPRSARWRGSRWTARTCLYRCSPVGSYSSGCPDVDTDECGMETMRSFLLLLRITKLFLIIYLCFVLCCTVGFLS